MVYFAAFIYKIVVESLGIENLAAQLRDALNDASVFPTTLPRMYMYSEKDELVSPDDVHDHAEEARQKGYAVVQERVFHNAPHAALLQESTVRYWQAVKVHAMGKYF